MSRTRRVRAPDDVVDDDDESQRCTPRRLQACSRRRSRCRRRPRTRVHTLTPTLTCLSRHRRRRHRRRCHCRRRRRRRRRRCRTTPRSCLTRGARQQEGADQFFMILARTCEGWQEGRRDVHRQRHASRRSHSCRAHRPPFMLTNVADITTPGRHQQEDDCEHVSAGWRVGDAGKHGGHHT